VRRPAVGSRRALGNRYSHPFRRPIDPAATGGAGLSMVVTGVTVASLPSRSAARAPRHTATSGRGRGSQLRAVNRVPRGPLHRAWVAPGNAVANKPSYNTPRSWKDASSRRSHARPLRTTGSFLESTARVLHPSPKVKHRAENASEESRFYILHGALVPSGPPAFNPSGS
jgi:hypothetical protein